MLIAGKVTDVRVLVGYLQISVFGEIVGTTIHIPPNSANPIRYSLSFL